VTGRHDGPCFAGTDIVGLTVGPGFTQASVVRILFSGFFERQHSTNMQIVILFHPSLSVSVTCWYYVKKTEPITKQPIFMVTCGH